MGDSAHTTHHTNLGKKLAPPLFLEDENIFRKLASMVALLLQFLLQLMLFKTTRHLGAKAQY
jgi:hypothetical protein